MAAKRYLSQIDQPIHNSFYVPYRLTSSQRNLKYTLLSISGNRKNQIVGAESKNSQDDQTKKTA